MDIKAAAVSAATNPQPPTQVKISAENRLAEHPDAAQFRQAMDRQQGSNRPAGPAQEPSLGQDLATRASGLAGEMNKDQQYVSKLLEKATTSGDSMQLMRAMLALNDYQMRVQTVSKVVSKASTSIDSLTKLQ